MNVVNLLIFEIIYFFQFLSNYLPNIYSNPLINYNGSSSFGSYNIYLTVWYVKIAYLNYKSNIKYFYFDYVDS